MHIDIDDGRVPDFQGTKSPRYYEVVSAKVGFRVVLRITGGPQSKTQTAFFILQNNNSSYAISVVPNESTGIACKSDSTV